MSPAVTVAY